VITDAVGLVLSFLLQNRQQLPVMLHPLTSETYRDATERALWLGDRLPLDLAGIEPISPSPSSSSTSSISSGAKVDRLNTAAASSPRDKDEDLSASKLLSPRKQIEFNVESLSTVQYEVRQTDLLDAKMPIVLESNNWLRIGGTLKELTGDFLQKECDQIIAANGGRPLPIGSAVVTKAGQALERSGIMYCVHCIGMGFSDLKDTRSRVPASPESVTLCTTSALEAADRLGLSQVAMPTPLYARPAYHSLGPDGNAAQVMGAAQLEAVKRFRGRKLKRVILCQQNALK